MNAWAADFRRPLCMPMGGIYFQNEEGVGYVVRASKMFDLLAQK